MCMGVCMCQVRGERTSCGISFSLCTMWVPGIKLSLSGSVADHLPMSHLTTPGLLLKYTSQCRAIRKLLTALSAHPLAQAGSIRLNCTLALNLWFSCLSFPSAGIRDVSPCICSLTGFVVVAVIILLVIIVNFLVCLT